MNAHANKQVGGLPVVLIYRDLLLPPSETFVRAQASTLKKFRPIYVGSRVVSNGLDLPDNDRLVVNRGGRAGLLSEAMFKLFGLAPRVVSAARRLNPALVHAHFGIDAVVAMPLVRRLRLPLVTTFHGYDATVTDDYARKSFRSHRRYVRERASLQREGRLFIAVSEFIRQRLLQKGFPSGQTVVHYIGIDLDLFRNHGETAEGDTVLFVGRLVEQKGCAYLLKAMARVRASVPDAQVTVVGDGPMRSALEQLANELRVPCHFTGVQTPEQVRTWMTRARVLVMPSVVLPDGWEEGFGLVSIEAQSMGLPVVASNTGGLNEAVSDGVSGLLVPPRDDVAIAHAVVRVLSDPLLWQRLRTAGQERVAKMFDLRVQTAALERLYEQTLANVMTD